MKSVVLLCVFMLCSCNAVKAPLKPHLDVSVRTIEVAKIEVSRSLLIRRVNPFFLAMGSSGLVADALVIANNAHRYEQKAGPVHRMSVELFEDTLMQALSEQGMKANLSGKRYWDYFKPSQKSLRERTDGILNIHLRHMGFWSQAVEAGYYPSVMVDVELVDPHSREVLYSDRFAIGIDFTSVRMMVVGLGEIEMFPLAARFSPYKNFKTLLSHPVESRNDLFAVMVLAAKRIAKGLQSDDSAIMIVFDPHLIESMPRIPLSSQLKADVRY